MLFSNIDGPGGSVSLRLLVTIVVGGIETLSKGRFTKSINAKVRLSQGPLFSS
jgi:hypothetical protein